MCTLHQKLDHDLGAPWVIVLAGGDGRRLEDVARARYGHARPKQFCDFGSGKTLLSQTIDRARGIAPDERIVVVTTRAHRAFADECLAAFPRIQRTEQPKNLDTTPGILHPLFHVLAADPNARVAILPSDHHVENDDLFTGVVLGALASLEEHADDILMLGAPAGNPEDGYGWIIPRVINGERCQPVGSFREKPPLAEIPGLVAQGALRNTFVLVARAAKLAAMVAEHVPTWHDALRAAQGDMAALDALYAKTPASNFSQDVLERVRDRLRAVALGNVGWDDIGTPDRLARVVPPGSLHGSAPRAPELHV